MLRENLEKFLQTLGWKANGLEKLDVEADPEADPVVDPEKDPEADPTPAPVQNKAETDPEPEVDPEPEPVHQNSEIAELKELIDGFGGVAGMKAILVNAAAVTSAHKEGEDREHANLIAEMVINSSETLKEEDLKDVELPLLRKMADAMRPTGFEGGVDYSLLGARQNTQHNAEQVAERPVIFTRNVNEEADDG